VALALARDSWRVHRLFRKCLVWRSLVGMLLDATYNGELTLTTRFVLNGKGE